MVYTRPHVNAEELGFFFFFESFGLKFNSGLHFHGDRSILSEQTSFLCLLLWSLVLLLGDAYDGFATGVALFHFLHSLRDLREGERLLHHRTDLQRERRRRVEGRNSMKGGKVVIG